MKEFVGKVKTNAVEFMDGTVDVKLLTVGDAKLIDIKTNEINKRKNKSDMDQLELLRYVVRLTVVGAEDLSDEDFESFPVAELTKLADAIMGNSADSGNE